MRTVCVFCGSSAGRGEQYTASAAALAQELVARKLRLVYGGGSVGLMGTLARAVRDGLGEGSVVGVIPTALIPRELSGETIGELLEVPDMHVRKEKMIALADAFICLPGGYGTLDELLEVTTGLQLGYHTKPVGVLNIPTSGGGGFFDAALAQFRTCVEEGFIREAFGGLVHAAADPGALLEALAAFQPPPSLLQQRRAAAQHPETAVRL